MKKLFFFSYAIIELGTLVQLLLQNQKFNSFLNKIQLVAKKIVNISISPWLWIISFISIAMIRDFIESIIEGRSSLVQILSPLTRIEYSFFWYGIFFSVAIFIHLISKRKISEISKLIISGWWVTLTPPIVDSLVYKSRFAMTYLNSSNNLLKFLTFYNNSKPGFEATYGIRVEIFFVILMISLYVASVTRNALKTIFSALGVYSIIFFYMGLPFFISTFLDIPYQSLSYPLDYIYGYLFIFTIIIPIYISLLNKNGLKKFLKSTKKFISIDFIILNKTTINNVIKNIRPFRVAHYSLLMIIGIIISFGITNSSFSQIYNLNNLIKFIGLWLSLVTAWLFAVGVNDIFDIGIDKTSNKNRPLIKQSITIKNYYYLSFLMLVVSLALSFWVSHAAGNIILYFIAAYSFVYSAPPFRLRRFLFIPNILIGLCSLLSVYLGLSFISKGQAFDVLPNKMALLIFLSFSLASTIKDIKDEKGDKKSGITTIPTLFGIKNGKKITGILLGVSFLLVPLFYPSKILYILSLTFSIVGYYLITNKNEKWVFGLEYIYLIILFSQRLISL
jgi:4-hydroxybenzoate polyprenyltransferase